MRGLLETGTTLPIGASICNHEIDIRTFALYSHIGLTKSLLIFLKKPPLNLSRTGSIIIPWISFGHTESLSECGSTKNGSKGFQLVRKYNLIALLEEEGDRALSGLPCSCKYAINFIILLTRSSSLLRICKHEQHHPRNKHLARVARFDPEGCLA